MDPIYGVNVDPQAWEEAGILQQLIKQLIKLSVCKIFDKNKSVFQWPQYDLSFYSAWGKDVVFLSNWSWSCSLSAASCRWSPSACRDFARASGSLQLAESHVKPWTTPSTSEGRPGGWADRCGAGQGLLCSHRHESRAVKHHCRIHLLHSLSPIPIYEMFSEPVSIFYSLSYIMQLEIHKTYWSPITNQQWDGLWTETEALKVINMDKNGSNVADWMSAWFIHQHVGTAAAAPWELSISLTLLSLVKCSWIIWEEVKWLAPASSHV